MQTPPSFLRRRCADARAAGPAATFLLASLCPTAVAQGGTRASAEPPAIRWEEHVGRARDGSPLPGRIGRILVPERRSDPDGARIEIAFVHYASSSPEPAPPLFFLAGGPGAPGIGTCEFFATAPEVRFLDHCDVIGVDQRGTGRSLPDLSQGPDFRYRLPLDQPLTRAAVIAADRDAIGATAAYWEAQGVDLAAYNTDESADDLEDVRRALGLEQIQLYGASYGSHLGLAYLRRHPEHVARAVLSKVEGPDSTWKLPGQLQRQLEKLQALIAADPAASSVLPDFLGTLRGLLERLAEEPVDVMLQAPGSEPLTVRCGPYDLQRAIGLLLANRDGLAQAVVAVSAMAQGDWTGLGRAALRARQGGDVSAMTVMMDCSSGASAERRERLRRELEDPRNLLGDAIDGFYLEVCAACGDPDLGEGFRRPFRCDVPVLFVSGDLDARTPPENVAEIRAGFSRAVEVLVENVGHPARELRSQVFCRLLAAWLRGEAVESTTLALPPIEFLLPGGSDGNRR